MGLDRDSLAAHRAEFEATHSRKGVEFKLLAGEVAALLTHFDSLDMDVDSVHYDVDASDEEGWKAEWEAYIEDAGLKGKSPAVRVIRFLRARTDAGAGSVAYNGRAKGVVTLLQSKGISLTDDTISGLERVLIKAEAGDINAQSTCIEVIWLIYLGELPSEKVVKWYDQQKRMMAELGHLAPIEVRNHPEYKDHVKDSTTPVLERVLGAWTSTGYVAWQQYFHLTKSRLHGHGYPLACRRFESVVSVPEEQFCSAENGKACIRKYLWSYFFYEFTGLGLPQERGQKSWDRVMLPPKGGEAQLLLEERPTMAKEAAASPLNGVCGLQQQVLMQAQQMVAGLGLGQPMQADPFRCQQPLMQPSWWQQMQQAAMMSGQQFPGQQSMQLQGGASPPQPGAGRIYELEQKGPCDFCGGAHHQDNCTKFRECVRKGKAEVRADVAAKIAARRAAAEAKRGEGAEN